VVCLGRQWPGTALTPEKETHLLAYCGPQLKPLVVAALHTGFHKAALLSLTWDDVDFRRGVITVPAAYAKNGESRSVPMNKLLTETLKVIRMSASTTQHVFCSRDGVPYHLFRSVFDRAV
jgi:integrase